MAIRIIQDPTRELLDIKEEIDKEELEECQIISPDNEQKLIYSLVPKEDIEYEEAKKCLTKTSPYHEWRETIADTMIAIAEEYLEEEEEETMSEWNEKVEEYNEAVNAYNLYGDLAELEKNNIPEPHEIGINV